MTSSRNDVPDDIPSRFELVAPSNEGWYHTPIHDWIALCPDVSRTAFRLYCVMRSLLLEKAAGPNAHVRLLTIDQLRWLLPGVNGKPCSETAIKDALRNLDQVGLVTNPDAERRITSTGHGGIKVTRRYQINDLPPAGYTGWRNAFEKLAAYQEDWKDNPAGQHVRRISDPQSDQGERPERPVRPSKTTRKTSPSPAETQETAGQLKGRKSDGRGRKSDDRGRKSGGNPAVTCENTPSLNSSSNTSLSGGDAGGPLTRTGGSGKKERETAAPEATAFVEALPGRVGRRSVQHLAGLVTAAQAEGWALPALREYLTKRVDPARVYGLATVYAKHLNDLPAFSPTDTPGTPVTDPCPVHPHKEAAECRPCLALDGVDGTAGQTEVQGNGYGPVGQQAVAWMRAELAKRKHGADAGGS